MEQFENTNQSMGGLSKLASLNSNFGTKNLNQIQGVKSLGKQFSSNNTMQYYQGAERPIVYLTAYVRAKVISISNISYQQMSAKLNCQLFIVISYRSIKRNEVDLILGQGIKLIFERDEMLSLSRDNPDVSIYDNQAEKRIQYVVRKFIKASITCSKLRLTPFQIINCEVIFKINKVKIKVPANQQRFLSKIKLQNAQEITKQFNFNMMDHSITQIKIQNSIDSDFGIFQIASAKLQANYYTSFKDVALTKMAKKQQKQTKTVFKFRNKKHKSINHERQQDQLALIRRGYGEQKLASFCVAEFCVPLYKRPQVASITIFLPLLVLSLATLTIFLCEPDLFKRISSIAAIIVAFVALVPTIRGQIPPTSKITLVQGLVFSEALTAILALFHSLLIIDEPPGWKFNFNDSVSGLFTVSAIITILVNIIVLILSMRYIFEWRPSYRNKNRYIQDFKQNQTLNILEWKNQTSDKYFKKFIQSKTLRVLEDQQFLENQIYKQLLRLGIQKSSNQIAQQNQRSQSKFRISQQKLIKDSN